MKTRSAVPSNTTSSIAESAVSETAVRPAMIRRVRPFAAMGLLAASITVACVAAAAAGGDRWSEEEREELVSLWLGSLDSLPADPTNRVADDPRAVQLGHRLFFDARLSSNGKVSCATCHQAEREFQDGTPLASGVGTTDRRTMPVAGTAHAPFLFWDGRKDSQWAQALGPLESPVEHGGTRAQYAHVIAEHYAAEYEALFGELPSLDGIPAVAGPVADTAAAAAWTSLTEQQRAAVTQVYVNIGKAIAAYERRLNFGASRFDEYVQALVETGSAPRGVLSEDEVAGLRLFIGKANCTQCHNGPLFTNNEFHNTGIPAAAGLPADDGRTSGAHKVLADEFNCRSKWSDARPEQCSELEYLVVDAHELERAFKVPSLRNVAERAPYMHAGQVASLGDALRHYNAAPEGPGGHSELQPLKLSEKQLQQLEAYLRALSGGTDAPAELLAAPKH
jgi:cytochrome c peroxidase